MDKKLVLSPKEETSILFDGDFDKNSYSKNLRLSFFQALSLKSKIVSKDQPEIKVDWRIYTKNPEKPLIRDLIVEGLSLARTQKEEFSSILSSNNNDINILISKLKEFTGK